MVKRKIDLQGDVFEGISSVFAVKGGIATVEGAATISEADMLEFPVSDDSGFNFDTGQPSIEHFKVKGLNTDWVNTFTPGDGEITLEIPCNETNIMQTCFGDQGVDASITLPEGITVGGAGTVTGKAYASAQKAVYLGLLILNDTEDKVLFIKKAKLMAQAIFDGSNKPLCVVLTGAISAGADKDAFGVLEPSAATTTSTPEP